VVGEFGVSLNFVLYWRNKGQAVFKVKIEVMWQLVVKVVASGFCFDCVVYDVWYFNFGFSGYVESLGKEWVIVCKLNCMILIG
jgi:hypothetical protein